MHKALVAGVNSEGVGERFKDCSCEMESALLSKDSGQCHGNNGKSGWAFRVSL